MDGLRVHTGLILIDQPKCYFKIFLRPYFLNTGQIEQKKKYLTNINVIPNSSPQMMVEQKQT